MTNYLVVTAMGADRPGIISKLARIASDCDCDIADSRMALFGNEFTLIMMLSGSWAAITKFETNFPQLSVGLELMTVMKRTSKHTAQNFVSRIEVTFNGQDKRGTMKKLTEFLDEHKLDLAALRSHAEVQDEDDIVQSEQTQNVVLTVNIPENIELETLENSFKELAASLSLDCSMRILQGIEIPELND
ncbi:glycine cleavage system protein R [Shewanella gelidii]|uniref:Glycine cleavage system transcriptional repressor n=1 Tax=Shewanella gelidii TaxID=1642821 RepID=A0A917JX76_9GAMM|nr:ACT domain-containing protein [Shewanella gelidii]MCL1099071.1 glycine cleavage system transcriptional repressor [Shewanella gelidii]GGI88404.1 glycine cleavage system protein R [Shewanella gelidii]